MSAPKSGCNANGRPNGNGPNGKNGRGRPTKYDPKRHPLIAALCAEAGLTEAQIADMLKVSVPTLRAWKGCHPDFLAALQKGRDFLVPEMIGVMVRRAKGYDYEERRTVAIRRPVKSAKEGEPDFEERVARIEVMQKHMPPNPGVLIFWLINHTKHLGDRALRDVRSVELSGPEGAAVQTEAKFDFSSLSDEQLLALTAAIAAGRRGSGSGGPAGSEPAGGA